MPRSQRACAICPRRRPQLVEDISRGARQISRTGATDGRQPLGVVETSASEPVAIPERLELFLRGDEQRLYRVVVTAGGIDAGSEPCGLGLEVGRDEPRRRSVGRDLDICTSANAL